jgi:FAD synthase
LAGEIVDKLSEFIATKLWMELPQQFSGEIVHGFGRGHRVSGFATANIAPQSWAVDVNEDSYGVYAGMVRIRGEPPRIGVISIGKNLTFVAKHPTFEVHILDFDEDIYGVIMNVDIRFRIRPMVLFESFEALKAQIAADAETARQLVQPLLNSGDGS